MTLNDFFALLFVSVYLLIMFMMVFKGLTSLFFNMK